MSKRISRRKILQGLGYAGAGAFIARGTQAVQKSELVIAGRPVDLLIESISQHTVRIYLSPLAEPAKPLPDDGVLKQTALAANRFSAPQTQTKSIALGNLDVQIGSKPLTVRIQEKTGRL